MYDIRHRYVFELISQHREHFDLGESKRPELQDHTNKKVVSKFKCEVNSFVLKEFVALSPKSYTYNYQALNEKTETARKLQEESERVIRRKSILKNIWKP